MNITVNGAAATAEGTVADLLVSRLDHPRPSGIAVAVNAAVVPRHQWTAWPLREGDTVEIVTAVQGG